MEERRLVDQQQIQHNSVTHSAAIPWKCWLLAVCYSSTL